MDEFTAKTNEIRRLHKVCRAKNAAVRQAYQSQVNCARGAHRLYLQALRLTSAQQACTDIDSEVARCVRAQYLHAARVLKDVLKELEGSTHGLSGGTNESSKNAAGASGRKAGHGV